jgi:hypothetical protein
LSSLFFFACLGGPAQKRTGATFRKKGSQRRTVKNPNAAWLLPAARSPDFWVNPLLMAKNEVISTIECFPNKF